MTGNYIPEIEDMMESSVKLIDYWQDLITFFFIFSEDKSGYKRVLYEK